MSSFSGELHQNFFLPPAPSRWRFLFLFFLFIEGMDLALSDVVPPDFWEGSGETRSFPDRGLFLLRESRLTVLP